VSPAGYGGHVVHASQVIPFKRGSQSAVETIGAVPGELKEGQGTIASGVGGG